MTTLRVPSLSTERFWFLLWFFFIIIGSVSLGSSVFWPHALSSNLSLWSYGAIPFELWFLSMFLLHRLMDCFLLSFGFFQGFSFMHLESMSFRALVLHRVCCSCSKGVFLFEYWFHSCQKQRAWLEVRRAKSQMTFI